MIAAGIGHFVKPAPFVAIVPKALPNPLLLVYLSGVFEILGGAGLLVTRAQHFSAWGLIALFIAVFPANINMLVNRVALGIDIAPWMLWVRLPLQALLIFWAYQYTK
jgi:uncharacterized membrane protein